MKVKLKDVIQLNPRESLSKGHEYRKISMSDLSEFERDIGSYTFEEYKGGTKFRNMDVLLARITPCLENGKTALVNILDDNEIAFGSTEYYVLRAIPEKMSPFFLYYLATSKSFRTMAIKSMTGTSGRQRVQKDAILNFEFDLPNLEDQKDIYLPLKYIDDKKSINREINDNLVTLSYTIWKEDFKYKLLNKGSRNTSFLDYGKIISGGTPSKKEKSYYENGNIPWITPKDLSNNSNIFISRGQNNITQLGLKSSSAKLMPDNSILFSSRAPIGYIGITKNPLSTNQGFKSIVPAKKEYLEFLYFLLLFLKSEIINNANGSTFKEISLSGMKAIKFPNIEQNKIVLFHEKISQILNKIRLNEEENIELGKIKNVLLNKFF